ncbi:unnamed protein product, partial [Ectocarpus sp. 12 AP-2014]
MAPTAPSASRRVPGCIKRRDNRSSSAAMSSGSWSCMAWSSLALLAVAG